MDEVVGLAADVGWMHGGFGRYEGVSLEASRTGLGGGVDRIVDALDRFDVSYLAADGGSTDGGPHFLGAGVGMTHDEGIRRSMEAVVPIALERRIPFLIGSCGMAGTTAGLEQFTRILLEVAARKDLHFRVALIDCEPDRELLRDRYRQGRIHAIGHAPSLTEETLESASHIVAMQGTEPLQRALASGADIVLSGRVSDSALFAALPLSRGIPMADAWHMAKVIDHGFTNLRPVKGVLTSVVGVADGHGFKVVASNPDGRVDAVRVAQATVYENSSPTLLREPPGTLDTSGATYVQEDGRTVRVSGSIFVSEPYTVKLEGASLTGYRTVTIGVVHDPTLIRDIATFVGQCSEAVGFQAAAQGIDPSTYDLRFRRHDGGLGAGIEGDPGPPGLCVIGDVVAPSQEIANAVMNMAHRELLHRGYPGRLHSTGNIAFPFSPSDIACGPVYDFTVWHAMELDDPLETCSIKILDV